jgi:hypothetical protein
MRASDHPGNLQQLVRFFVPTHWSEQTWTTAFTTVFDQLAVMPIALARSVRVKLDPRWPVSLLLATTELVGLVALSVAAFKRQDRPLKLVTGMVLLQIGVAILAVRAIRGEVEFYLVTWVSLLGFMSSVALMVWLVTAFRRLLGERPANALVLIGAGLLLAFALTGPVERGPVIRARDTDVEQLAQNVELYLRSARVDRPTIRIPSPECWPSAAAVVLYLYKRALPVSVEDRWVTVVGKPFRASPGEHMELLFGNRGFNELARARQDLTFVAAAGEVYVYLQRPSL